MSRALAVSVLTYSLLLSPSGNRTSYATNNTKSPLCFPGSVALSTSQPPRRPAPLPRSKVASSNGTARTRSII
jgi:hypothetical protein